MEIGLKNSCTVTVDESNTAKTMGSGTLDVFATPAMIALMEKTAWQAVQPYMEEGCGTVGIRLAVEHLAATPVGCTVRCEATLTAVEGRKLTFALACYDEAGLVGKGEHDRFIVKNASFQAKADSKKPANA